MIASRSSADWRVLRALCLYRLVVAPLLAILFFSGLAPDFLALRHPAMFQILAYAWFGAGSLLMIAMAMRTPGFGAQTLLHAGSDLLFISGLLLASTGISSGLGALLLIPILGIGMLVPARIAALAAALATFALFGVEIAMQFPADWEAAPLTQAGVLGAVLFVIATTGSTVATRARRSEAIAERAGSALDSLSRLNDTIVETMRSGVVVVDELLRVRTLNRSARELLQYRGGVIGHSLRDIAPELADALNDWDSGRPSRQAPLKLGDREVLVRFSALGDAERAPMLLLLDDAQRARDQAQRLKLAALGRLSASIAHEIRNPLSAIRQATDLLDGETNAGQASNLRDIIRRHATRIDGIVRDVLDIGRGRPPEADMQSLGALLHRAREQFLESDGLQHPAINIALPDYDASTEVQFDTEHFCRVMHNLWRNSAEQGARNISISTQHEGTLVALLISDDGKGVDPAIGEQIFEPFFTTSARGTGLGLYLARTLCEANHAALQLTDRGHGAHFMLRIPASIRTAA